MKRQIVTIVLITLTLISFNGCCPKPPLVVYVPQKCVIPKVDQPIIDNEDKNTSKDIVSKAILNYLNMKQYAEKLLASQKVCE